jgi:hypothetical protein
LKTRRDHLIPASIREAENFKFPRFFWLTVTTQRKRQVNTSSFFPTPCRVRVAVHPLSIPLHAAPVLAANLVKRAADLAERALRMASISTAKTLPLSITACLSFSSMAGTVNGLYCPIINDCARRRLDQTLRSRWRSGLFSADREDPPARDNGILSANSALSMSEP